MKTLPTGRPRRAFTLVELLTVIAVIAVLAGILFAVIGGVRQKTLMAKCTGRLRYLAVAYGTYAADNKGTFLPTKNTGAGRWHLLLMPYVDASLADGLASGKVTSDQAITSGYFKCPTMDDVITEAPFNRGAFAHNINLDLTASRPQPVRLNVLSSPSTFPVLVTTDNYGGPTLFASGGTPGPSPNATKYGYTGSTNIYGPGPNFGGKAMFLFADWHVAAVDICDVNAWPWNTPDSFKVR